MTTSGQPRLDDTALDDSVPDNAGPAEVVRRFNAAWGDHDLAAALALTGDECVFEATSPAPDGERYVGRTAVGAAWKPIFDDVASRFTVEDTFAAGGRVVQRWRYDWADGHIRGVDILAVKDGQVTEKIAYVKG
jgi:ketosteroid isomerase-like protein